MLWVQFPGNTHTGKKWISRHVIWIGQCPICIPGLHEWAGIPCSTYIASYWFTLTTSLCTPGMRPNIACTSLRSSNGSRTPAVSKAENCTFHQASIQFLGYPLVHPDPQKSFIVESGCLNIWSWNRPVSASGESSLTPSILSSQLRCSEEARQLANKCTRSNLFFPECLLLLLFLFIFCKTEIQ